MKSELMAAIYDKALKRKDFSGIVDKDKLNAVAKANGMRPRKLQKMDQELIMYV